MERATELTFDQLAIVDYHVVSKADVFMGVGMSTFSLVIAYGRAERQGVDIIQDVFRKGLRQDSSNQTSPMFIGTNDTMVVVTSLSAFSFLPFFP